MSRDLYGTGASGIEIDLRSQLEEFFSGSTGEIPKEQRFILRKTRRDDDGNPIECECVSRLTQEPDTEDTCPFCFGHRYYFDEVWVTGYTMYVGARGGHSNRRINIQPGLVSAYDKVFYLRYTVTVTYDDKIIELKLDSDGNPVVPYKRKMIFRPETIMEMRSDFGRTEFLAIYVNENSSIRVR